MPEYTYRREDGTTFNIKQKFSDNPLTVDPTTGQKVVRVVQPAGIIFKGSGFYVNDSKNASKKNLSSTASNTSDGASSSTEKKPTEAKSESKPASSAAD